GRAAQRVSRGLVAGVGDDGGFLGANAEAAVAEPGDLHGVMVAVLASRREPRRGVAGRGRVGARSARLTAESRHAVRPRGWAMNTAEFLQITAMVVPDRTALVCGEKRVTFMEMADRVNRLANWLQSVGAGPDHPVGAVSTNSV